MRWQRRRAGVPDEEAAIEHVAMHRRVSNPYCGRGQPTI